MKKIKYLLFILIMSIAFIPNVLAKDSVEITSITLEEKSENADVISNPTYSGLEMNYNISYKAKDEYVKYKVVIKNNTNKNYKISKEATNQSDHLSFNYDVTGELKANSETTVYVTITYSKEIDASELVDGKYTESSKSTIKILDENGNIINPSTGRSLFILSIIIALLLTTVLLKIRKKNNLPIMILIGIFLIPTIVYAVEVLSLTTNVNVEIKQGFSVNYLLDDKGVIYTDEEAYNYVKTDGSDCGTLYLGQKKYNECSNLIYKDNKIYLPGETVNLKPLELKAIQWDDRCVDQDENTTVCPDDDSLIESYSIDTWSYFKNININGRGIVQKDPEIMNFTSIYDNNWSHGYIGLKSPQTFTMTNQDVWFEPYERTE